MDNYDRELYYHPRLPKPTNDDGPTARYLRWLEELDARVVPFIVEDALPFDVKEGAA